MFKRKKSILERLAGGLKVDIDDDVDEVVETESESKDWIEENNDEAQLTADVYQTSNDIVIKAMVAGVKPDDLDVSITQDMITIKGSRHESHKIDQEDYFYEELYWGSFSRSILLPQEVDPDDAEASLKNGILTIKLPKLDKERVQKL